MVVIAVPHNMIRYGGRVAGLDAFFWRSTGEPYRRVLLIRPAEELLEEPPPGSCVLGARVGLSEQMRDLELLSSGSPGGVERRRGRGRLFLYRIAGLFVPGGFFVDRARRLLEEQADRANYSIAVHIAKSIMDGAPAPLGETRYLALRVVAGLRGLVDVEGPGSAPRAYLYLSRLEEGFEEELLGTARRCLHGRGGRG